MVFLNYTVSASFTNVYLYLTKSKIAPSRRDVRAMQALSQNSCQLLPLSLQSVHSVHQQLRLLVGMPGKLNNVFLPKL